MLTQQVCRHGQKLTARSRQLLSIRVGIRHPKQGWPPPRIPETLAAALPRAGPKMTAQTSASPASIRLREEGTLVCGCCFSGSSPGSAPAAAQPGGGCCAAAPRAGLASTPAASPPAHQRTVTQLHQGQWPQGCCAQVTVCSCTCPAGGSFNASAAQAIPAWLAASRRLLCKLEWDQDVPW